MRVLVVEDDEVISNRLVHSLTKEGYDVDRAADGVHGLSLAAEHPYAVILLDLMIPGKDGWAVCRELRAQGKTTPILMLTARDQTADKVKGLDEGADDYLPKPFDFTELLARMRALIRRGQPNKSTKLYASDLELDTTHRSVNRGEETIHLTPREYSLLEALARHAGRTLTREMIIGQVWGDDESLSNTVNFHVTALRRKIDGGREKSLIETIHGFGYRLRRD